MTAALWPGRLWGTGAKPHGAKWGLDKRLPFLQSRERWLVVAESIGVTSAKLLQPPGVGEARRPLCGRERSWEPWTRIKPEKGSSPLLREEHPGLAPALTAPSLPAPLLSCRAPGPQGDCAGRWTQTWRRSALEPGGLPSWVGFSILTLEYQCQTGSLIFFLN